VVIVSTKSTSTSILLRWSLKAPSLFAAVSIINYRLYYWDLGTFADNAIEENKNKTILRMIFLKKVCHNYLI